MPIPTWVDFESAERSASVMARGLSGSSEAWGTLLANAQAILASRTDTSHSRLHSSYDFDEWRDLVAAARILDLAATEIGIDDLENRKAAAILGSLCIWDVWNCCLGDCRYSQSSPSRF